MPCCAVQVGGLSVHLSTDSVHISRLPRYLSAPDRQLVLFAEQLLPHNPAAAAACSAIVGHTTEATPWLLPCMPSITGSNGGSSSSGSSSDGGFGNLLQQQQQGVPRRGWYGAWMSACFTYSLPDASKHHWLQQALGSSGSDVHGRQQQQQQQLLYDEDDLDLVDWDDDSAWHPYAQYRCVEGVTG